MDSMIGLLFLLLPVLFGLIGKKLDKAGVEGEDAPVEPSMPEVFPTIRKFMAEEYAEDDAEEDISPAEEEAVSSLASKKTERVIVSSKAVEEEEPRKKEPIDPKKLVIYSEIMKPKF